ncbi:hypothetical protein R1sor_008379 [Riccia sorocarpa]|uniref:Aminotransferase-like plant mobile domain-containing protein n=1 Tax=Riccia sorocarpa TaxID=122646 RepID=A0ABD3HT70_9MARC
MAAQAGAPLHFELYTEQDDVNYIRWKWISKKEAHRVLRGIDGRLLRRSGLHDALWMDWARPEEETTSVREFVLNWDDRTQSSTVGGREIPLTIDTMREYFLLPQGLNPPWSARHYDDLSDWVPERSRTAKTWYANDVFLPVWRPIIQLINVVLLGKQKPLEVTEAFLYILKNKVGPADEDENLDWATYFKEKQPEPRAGLIFQQSETGACLLFEQSRARAGLELQQSGPRTSQSAPKRHSVFEQPKSHKSGITDQHSPESRQGGEGGEGGRGGGGGAPSTLSDHATRSGSPSSPDRGQPVDNEPLAGFGSPMVLYPASDDDEEGVVEGAIKGLTSLGAADLATTAKGKRPVLHKSSSESEEIRFARPDRVKRRVAVTEDEAGGPVSQQAEVDRLTAMVNELKRYLDEANKSLDHTKDKNSTLSRENKRLEKQLSTVKIFGTQASAEKEAWENREVHREQWLKQMKLREE